MNEYYIKSTVYLSPQQKELIQKFMPYKLSSIVRDVIDVILQSDSLVNQMDFNDPELLGRLYDYRKYLTESQETYKNREQLRKELYTYFDEVAHVPLICARDGHKRALKLCRDVIPYFRSEGNIISDRVAEQMIVEYVHMIEATGKDDQVWMNYQNSKTYEALANEDGTHDGLLTKRGLLR